MKEEKELEFWINSWKKKIESKGYFNNDIFYLLKKYNQKISKDGFLNEAKAQLYRIIEEFELNKNIFLNKKVLEIGPGAVQFIEICKAKEAVGIDPLINKFKEHKLINNFSNKITYLNKYAENISFDDSYFGIVLSRNNLDHTNKPKKVISEMARVLKKEGLFLLSTDINHIPTHTEPHILKINNILKWIKKSGIDIIYLKMDKKTYNYKEGNRIIIKGIKNGKD